LHSEKEFKVNDYITLKIEGEDTNIYIRGRYFRQCKYLLLNFTITQISSFEDIKSIDESGLYLSETPIKNLPDSISNSNSIETIDISDTQISVLPDSIVNIKSLKEIIVSKSYMNNIPRLRKLMAPLKTREIQILFKVSSLSSRFAYFTNKLDGDKPYSRQLY